jgi:hypothetical protein
MNRNAGGWGLKQAIASIGATIFIGWTAAVPVVVSLGGNLPAVSGLTVSPLENNWG